MTQGGSNGYFQRLFIDFYSLTGLLHPIPILIVNGFGVTIEALQIVNVIL
jgi:hypothetical protein